MRSSPCNPDQFAKLLSQAIRRISAEDNHTLASVQEELGKAIGRLGHHTIDYWRRGHIPQNAGDVERLARELVRRKGLLNPEELRQFLDSVHISGDLELFTELSVLWSNPPKSNGGTPPRKASPTIAPFTHGRPLLYPRQFFGRQHALQGIFRSLEHFPLQPIALVGPRYGGKTSLLHYLRSIGSATPEELRSGQKRDWLSQPESYRWVFIDFQNVCLGKPEMLFQNILAGLGFDAPHPCRLSNFVAILEKGLKTPCIILMDEIGQAAETTDVEQDSFWRGLRSLVCSEAGKYLGLIVADQTPPHQLAVHSTGGYAKFLGLFGYIIELGAFTRAEACELIASSPHPLLAEDVTWLLEQSQGWPVLLQAMCRARWNAGASAETGWKAEALKQSVPYRFLLDASTSHK